MVERPALQVHRDAPRDAARIREGPYGRIYQSGQSAELLTYLQAIAAMPGKMIVAGDFNSDPRDQPFTLPQWLIDYLLGRGAPPELIPYLGIPPYMQMAGSGFTDVWTLRPGAMTGKGAPLVGFSCCQDADLANQQVCAVRAYRPDLVLHEANQGAGCAAARGIDQRQDQADPVRRVAVRPRFGRGQADLRQVAVTRALTPTLSRCSGRGAPGVGLRARPSVMMASRRRHGPDPGILDSNPPAAASPPREHNVQRRNDACAAHRSDRHGRRIHL